jgi:two-component system sensor histidine kinase VicK
MFLDIGLPGMSGIEVLKQVKEKDPSVRVIMITGQTESELVRQSTVLGADDYVTKPFTLEYLSGEVLDKLHKQLFHELRSTSQDLAVEREKAELLFEQMQEGVMLVDMQGLVFMANPKAKAMLGLADEISGVSATKAFDGFKYEPADRLAKLEADKGEPFDMVREASKNLILEVKVSPILTHQRRQFGYMIFFRDVTMERKADTAMHRFISLISHKLRTPLVTIRAYPRLLLSENSMSPLNEFQRGALETIAKQCRHMEDMVNQLIAFSSLDPEELLKQKMSLAEVLAEALKLMPDELRGQVNAIHLAPALSKLHIDVDPTLVQHAVRNVLENAFKFGATELHVDAQENGDQVQIRFSDNGPGIPPEDRDRIFERFYQVEKTFCGQVPGAGLGLTMVKQTVEAHGGHVWAESQMGKGATFFVELPKAA